jgi:large subunit ribosomal protein L35
MFDPDAPSKENPIYKSWLHWIKTNIHNKSSDIVAPFMPPSPPAGSGLHRYCICLLEQQKQLEIAPINERKKFDFMSFVNRNKLKPISYVMYATENEAEK